MPAFTAVGAYVAGTVFGLVGTAALVVGAVVATGAAYITSRVINGNPNKGNNSARGSQGGRIQVPPATNNKIPVVYGSAYVNGTITDARLISTDQKTNNTMYYCIVLSETCQSGTPTYTVNDIYWNDLRLTFDATDGYKVKDGRKTVDGPGEDFVDTNFIVDNKNLVEVRVYAGGTAAADQIFPTTGTTPAYTYWAGNDGSWNSDYAMRGLVFAIVKVTYNGEKGFTGLPNMTFQLENSINNPADVWYDYMTGVRYGANIDPSNIDGTARTAWSNFCDEDIVFTNKDGTANQYTTRYAINGVIDTNRSVKENIDIIIQNGGAWLSYNVNTGLWSPIIKKAVSAGELGLPATYFTASRTGSTLTVTDFPTGRIEAGQLLYNSSGTLIGTIVSQTTPSGGETAGQIGRYTTSTSGSISSTTFYTLPATMLSFSDDNIISGISISSTRLDDLYNSYEAEFYDKFNKDQKAYARDALPSAERNPNEPDNQLRLSLDLCNNSVQADLLAKIELAQSRDDLVIEFTANHYGIQAQAGDVVSIYSDLYDWQPKYFRVMRVKEQETEEGGLVAQIQALEYNPDVYTIEPLTEFTTSANIGIGVYAASPNLPQPPVVEIIQIDTNVAIPNFQLQIKIPVDGGPYDEIELYYTEGWDPMSITGSIVPGTGSNGAPVGNGLLTVTAIDYGALNVGDNFIVGSTNFNVTSQLTNTPASKTFASGGAPFANTVTLTNTTGLLIGNNLKGTGLPALGAHITAIAGSQVTLDKSFSVQAAGTYTVEGGLGTYVVDTSATLSGTTTLYDLPVDSDYAYLKKHTPDGNNPTFTNGESIAIVITEVPANTQTYRRWFVKARMGIKKRFGKFSTPTITDLDGNFRYTPSPTGGGSLNDLTDVDITSPNEGQTLYYDATASKWKNNSILEVDDTATRGGIVIGEGITQPMITFAAQPDGVNALYGIRGFSTVDDPWFIGSGSAGNDLGYLEIATGDNISDDQTGGQIYVRQYNNGATAPFGVPWYGGTGTVVNELTLLDNNGHTIIPKNLTVDSGTLFVDATNNRVGINNLSPAYALDVTGEIRLSGENLYMNQDNTNLDVTIHFNTGRNIKWDHDNQRFELNGDTYISDDLTVDGGNINLNGTAQAGVKPFLTFATQADGANSMYGIRGMSTVDDPWFVGGASTGDDAGYLEIATGDNSGGTNSGGEIYVRQYSGSGIGGAPWYGGSGTIQHTLTLLDNVGNTTIPNSLLVNDVLFVDHVNNRVGVNVLSPNFALDVAGDAYISGDLTVAGNDIKSSTATAITLSGANVEVIGDLTITGNDIKKSGGTTIVTFSGTNLTTFAGDIVVTGNTIQSSSASAIQLSGANVEVIGDLTITGNDIYSGGGTLAIQLSGADVSVAGDLTVEGNDIKSSTATALSLSGANVTVAGDLTVSGNDIKSSTATALTLSGADVTVVGDLTVTGDDIKKSGGNTVLTFSGTNLVTTAGDIAIGGNTIRDSASTAAIELSGANVTVEGTLEVNGNQIKNSATNTVITMSGLNTVLAGTLELDGNQILSSTGATAITLSGTDVAVAGDLTVTGNDIKSSSATALTFSGANVTVAGDLTVTGNDIKSSSATAITLSGIDVAVAGDIDVNGAVTVGNLIKMYDTSFGVKYVETEVRYDLAVGNLIQTADFWTTSLRTAKYTISMTKGTDYHCLEIMVIHDGTNAYKNVTNEIFTNASLATFSVDVNLGTVRLRVTPATTGNLDITMERKLFT